MNDMRNFFMGKNFYFGLVLLTVVLTTGVVFCGGCKTTNRDYIKNIIVMVPDGCSHSIQTLSRWYKGEALELDQLVSGSVKTHMANSVITGSAAAATAFATGHKTTARFLGIGPRTDDLLTGFRPTAKPYVPIASVLEGSKLMGKSVGLIATSRITHATPAAYACHIQDRGMENEIMEHMVYQDLDVVFGGGKRHLLPISEGGKRTDGENLLNVLLDRNYTFVETKEKMDMVTEGKVWGLFASSHMAPDIDRTKIAPGQPSLSEMTEKAIELLSKNEKGFFLMVEGSQVDWAGHANDPIHMVTDFLAFDRAVKVAVDFAESNGDTLVVIFSDHNTGALSIGNGNSDLNYTETTIQDLIDPLKKMKISAGGIAFMIGEDLAPENIMAELKNWWGIEIHPDDANEILNRKNIVGLQYAIGEVVSKKYTLLGWTTHGHSGEDVPLWTYGKNKPEGLFDNTELAKVIAGHSNFELSDITKELFVPVDEVFSNYTVDDTDPENIVLKINKAELPVNKDVVNINGKTYNLEGIVVYAPMIHRFFIPLEAVDLIKSM